MVADGHYFSPVKRLNRRFLDLSKNALNPPAFGAHFVSDQFEFHQDFWRQ